MKRLIWCVLLAASVAWGQQVVIRAGNLIDPATGQVAKNQTVLIKDKKIVEVGPSVGVPKDAEVIDLSNAWVMPGMMDAHTHITMNIPPSPAGGSLWDYYLLRESTALRALRGILFGQQMLNAGFTVVRDVGNAGDYAEIADMQAIEKGWFQGPTIIGTGKIIAPFGGQSHGITPEQGPVWHYEYIDADSPDEVRKAIRQNIFYGAKAIKLVADNSAFHYRPEELKAAVEVAHAAGLKVAVHVGGGQAAFDVINAGADSIEHGWELTDEHLKLMKEKNVYLVGTDFPQEHLNAIGGLTTFDVSTLGAKLIDRLARAYRIGTPIAFGSDAVVNINNKDRAQMTLDYLEVFSKAGVKPADMLKMLTTNCADLLGIKKERGAIAAGQYADIIAMPASPLADIQALRKVDFVMKEGAVVRRPK